MSLNNTSKVGWFYPNSLYRINDQTYGVKKYIKAQKFFASDGVKLLSEKFSNIIASSVSYKQRRTNEKQKKYYIISKN